MSYIRVQVDFTRLPDDDAFVLDQLTEELADDLREVGDVDRVPGTSRGTGATGTPHGAADKGVAEVALAAVSVLVGTDPGYVQALVDVVLAFTRRNAGRRAHLRVGDIELTVDQPSRDEVAEMIRTARAAILKAR